MRPQFGGVRPGLRPAGAAGARPPAGGLRPGQGAGARPAPVAPGLRPGGGARPPAAQASQLRQPGAGPRPVAALRPPAGAAQLKGLTVTTQSTNTEIGIQTLVGDYEENSSNHDKKVYKKVQKIEGHEDVSVFVYYWDKRDGDDFSGWWFGDQVGGSQVWARAPAHGPTPPRIGWKIPWDSAKAEPGVLQVDPAASNGGAGVAAAGVKPGGAVANPYAAKAPPATEEQQEEINKAKEEIDQLEGPCKEALAASKLIAATSVEAELEEAIKSVQAQQTACMEAQKSLTQNTQEAKKGGSSTLAVATELVKLSPRIRLLQQGLSSELVRVKGFMTKSQANAANAKKQAELAEKNKEAEERDSATYEEQLPGVQEQVAAAEESTEAVIAISAPLIAEADPNDDSDMLKSSIEEVETAATDALSKIAEARQLIAPKLLAAQKFAPATRTKALAEYKKMQQTMTDMQTKVTPYRTFKKEFTARVQARKSLQDTADKLNELELEVEKVKMMSSGAEHGQMSEEDVVSAEKTSQPAKTSIENVLRTLEQKLKVASGGVKEEITSMKGKALEIKKSLDGVLAILQKQRQTIATAVMLKSVGEKVAKIEEILEKCGQAELPWLKGVEVLPKEESEQALKECTTAATQGDAAVTQARSFVKLKRLDVQKLVKEVQADVTEELNSQSNRLEDAAKKLGEFKKETNERKVAAILAEAVDAISQCEKKVEVLVKASEVFTADDLLEASSIDTLKSAVEKTAAAEKEASAALLEARKIFGAKQAEAKGLDQSALAKLQGRLTTAQTEVAKAKKAAASGEKLITGKSVHSQEGDKIKKVEDEVNSALNKVKPNEEQQALGIEEATAPDEEIEAMGTMLVEAQKTLQGSSRLVEASILGAPPALKASLQKLTERCKVAQKNITEVLGLTKEQRERVMSEAFVKQGKEKVAEIEKAVEKCNEAELPYLKGLEVSASEASSATTASEAAINETQAALKTARDYIATKNLELKKFMAATAKPAQDEFVKLTEQINKAASELAKFKKETEGRKKTAQMQEAGEKVNTLEAELKKLAELVEPFAKEDEGEHSEEETDKLVAQLKATQELVEEVKSMLSARQKDITAHPAHSDTVKDLQKRFVTVQTEMGKHKKVAGKHEQKYTAKKSVEEANETLATMEAEVQKAMEFCAPLLEHGGEKYLVQASIRILMEALSDHMTKKELSKEAIFKVIAGDKDSITQDAFVSYLEKLPEASGHEEVEFNPERRVAIFKEADLDGDGALSLEEFKAAFKRKYKCVKEISLTDVFAISESKTIAKVESGGELDTEQGPRIDENGMTRVECTVTATGKTGFVTMLGNSGTKFAELVSPFGTFCIEMDKTLVEALRSCGKVSAAFGNKIKEFSTAGKDSPLVEARNELTKLRSKVATIQNQVSSAKMKGAGSILAYKKKELAEKNAHIEAKERKAAEEFIAPAVAKVEAAEAAANSLGEAAKPLVSLSGTDLEEFATPASVLEETQKLASTVTERLEEAKKAISEQQAEAPKDAKDAAMLAAKKELAKHSAKMDLLKKQSQIVMDSVRKNSNVVREACSAKLSGLLRSAMQSKGTSVDQLFNELASGSERISEEAFCKYIQGLQGEAYKSDPVSMVCRQVDIGGIGRRRLQSFLQQYFVVVKGIAITDDLDISKAKTVRKLDLDEHIELLEGPKTGDEEGAMRRLRGRSLRDGAEGWVTLKGNQGTPFLKEVEKPHYSCKAEVPLERNFKSEGADGLLRSLKVDEVLELIEGPRTETVQPVQRVRGKATSDEALGWFTVSDKTGNVFAEQDSKYYVVTGSVAMTDNRDIKECKILRKLAAGELFLAEEAPVEEEGGIKRIKATSLKDSVTGWLTLKGNAGTTYAEVSTKHYVVLREVPLTKMFPSAAPGEEVRTLTKGEALLALEGPKQEASAAETRAKVKAISDNVEGWVTLKPTALAACTSFYTCKVATPVHETIAIEGATTVRQTLMGEIFELMEGPTTDGKDLRMRARAKKDGIVGWVTIKTGDGKRLFECK